MTTNTIATLTKPETLLGEENVCSALYAIAGAINKLASEVESLHSGIGAIMREGHGAFALSVTYLAEAVDRINDK